MGRLWSWESQPAVLMIHAVEQKEDLKMPLARPRLKDEDMATLRKWIDDKLPWTAAKSEGKQRNSDHWAFQAPKHAAAPAVRNVAWVRNPIDNFILAKLEQDKVRPSTEADRATLLRRVASI